MLDKKYLKRVGLYIGGSLLAIGIACYMGYHLWQSVTREIETVPAIADTFSVTAEYDAWVFRDEVIVSADSAGGTVVPSLKDGERVGKSSPVGNVYSNVPVEKSTELDTVRSQIELLRGQHSTTISGDLGIGEAMRVLASKSKNGDLSGSADIASRLVALAAARATGGGNTEAVIATLEERENEILASLGTSAETVYTPYSGWYYRSFDGYESVFTPGAVEGITPDRLEELLESKPAETASAAGRIVRTYKWYLAVNMTGSHGAYFKEGGTTEIMIPGVADPLVLTVESVVNGSGNRAAVVFSCGTIPDGYDIGRRLTVDFTLNKVTGFGVPKEAVRMQDDVTGVYTYNGVVTKFRRIEIVAEYDNMYIAAIKDNFEAAPETKPPATTAGESSDGNAEVTTNAETTAEPVAGGTGRDDYLWLEANEFIVVKGKALYNGRVIG